MPGPARFVFKPPAVQIDQDFFQSLAFFYLFCYDFNCLLESLKLVPVQLIANIAVGPFSAGPGYKMVVIQMTRRFFLKVTLMLSVLYRQKDFTSDGKSTDGWILSERDF